MRNSADRLGTDRFRAPQVPRTVLRLVAFIVFAQKVGLSLEEIRGELARLPRNRAPERADWAKLSGAGRNGSRSGSRNWNE